MDLVIDTRNGIGRQPVNSLRCLVEAGSSLLLTRKTYHLGTAVVEKNNEPKNEKGSLILDFGNTASCAIYSEPNTQPQNVRPVYFHNPFDPFEFNEELRPVKEKCILNSTAFVLRVPETKFDSPWIVLGKRAEELIKQEPLATSLFAPRNTFANGPRNKKPRSPRFIIGA